MPILKIALRNYCMLHYRLPRKANAFRGNPEFYIKKSLQWNLKQSSMRGLLRHSLRSFLTMTQ